MRVAAAEDQLLTRVARLYHHLGLGQSAIAERLDLSQSTVSRLLARARAAGIVRVSVEVPPGASPDLEEALQARYGLRQAIVVDASADDEDALLRELGAAAAYYLETTLRRGDVIGISSWSASLLATVNAMHPLARPIDAPVVQILGGVGNPAAEVHATHLTQRLARLLAGDARLLPAPGVVGSAEARRVLMGDRYVAGAVGLWDRLTIALVGIGALEPSRLLAASGNAFAPDELRALADAGAVGDVCLRFFDSAGSPVATPLDDRVIGIEREQLRRVRRAVGIAGGRRKVAAIRAALRGRWVNVLVTDRRTGQALIGARAGEPR
jgi:DNA-binding transcriptional regulator LsrR (DeoR family)